MSESNFFPRSPHVVREFRSANGGGTDPMNAIAHIAGVNEREVIPQGVQKAVRGFTLHPKANIVTYYDSLAVDNTMQSNTLTFFQAKPSQNPAKNFYTDNPLPGQYPRYVVGLSIETNLQALVSTIAAATPLGKAGATNNINPVAILNALKNAYIRVQADQNEKMVLNARLADYFDFENSGISSLAGTSTNPIVAVNFKSKGIQRISDPFMIAPNQVFKANIVFNNTHHLPAPADWTAAYGANPEVLELVVTLHTAEIK